MPKLTQKLLEQYHDGELSPRKARWVEQQLRNSPEHAEALKKIAKMGTLLNLMAEETLSDVSFEGFETRVAAGIRTAARPGLKERINVWVSEFITHRRTIWVPTAGIATAAIAVLIALPFVSGPTRTPPPGSHIEEIQLTSHSPSPSAVGSTIVSVRMGQANGWKYQLKDDSGGTIGVAWIAE
ncbi:MAG: hypothetical protein QNJ97_17430 [Myxococcota bacterium]|nr:hypothetical protein [Myxococcota bacterium]